MDLSKNVVLKENYTFLVADESGQVQGGEDGLYNRDTRFLSRYAWDFENGVQALVIHSPRPDRLTAHYAQIEGPSQILGIRRALSVGAEGFEDTLTFENTSLEPQSVTLKLTLASDFADMFEARGWQKVERSVPALQEEEGGYTLRYEAQDGLETATRLTTSEQPIFEGDTLSFSLALEPGDSHTLSVTVALTTPYKNVPGMSYDAWLEGFASPQTSLSEDHKAVLEQARLDLRALLLFTEHGPYLAAGIPWYVAAFGRDALLSAAMLLPHQPEVASGVLRFLAAYQGKKTNAFRAEAPGKIMHELRHGELTRSGKVPFGPYYGTVDATALFVVLLHTHFRATQDDTLVRELRPNWEAALRWMTEDADADGDGFLEFTGVSESEGLTVQSWKDSFDSMSHRDGHLATGAVAGSEVQGYAYAACLAAADFYEALGEGEAEVWRERAASLKTAFHEAFWLPDLQTYAMALDGDKTPLAVQNSNAGQLLWTGIVPDEVAPALVETLFSAANWSGWGVRTLGTGEVRYNPVSYHNGSVWPHDTALTAGGLARYGFGEEAARIREALYDLASSQPDKRLPELVAGYTRSDAPPVPYPVACRPQAWDAAALLYLLTL